MFKLRNALAALALAGLLSLPSPAGATILYFTGEDTGGMTAFGTATVAGCGGGGAGCDTNFARAAWRGVTNSTTDPPPNRFSTPTFTSQSLLWVHGEGSWGDGGSSTNNAQAVLVRSPDGVSRIVIRQTATNGLIKVTQRNAAGTLTDLCTAGAVTTSAIHSVDLRVDYSASPGGVTLYLDGVLACSTTGDPRTDAATQLNQVDFAGLNADFTIQTGWSEIIIATTDTRSMRLYTCALQASGNTQSWTPNTLSNVNKAAINDSTSVSTPTNNQLSQWTCPTTAPTGTWTVQSMDIEARVKGSVGGPQNFDWSFRIGGSDYLAGTTTADTLAFANYRDQFDVSPATSSAWAITEIFNTSTNELNVGVKSLP